MSKLLHDRVVAIEHKEYMCGEKIDQQIDKLKAVEKLEKEKQAAANDEDYLRANDLNEQLKHAQAEYDAVYKSADPTADDTSN